MIENSSRRSSVNNYFSYSVFNYYFKVCKIDYLE